MHNMGGRAVSIHAPRVGRDARRLHVFEDGDVSIHAPRVGRDVGRYAGHEAEQGFNPRAPCGARPPTGA